MRIKELLRFTREADKTFINDRRRDKRYDIPLKLTYLDSNTQDNGEVFTRNISKKGVRFSIKNKIPCDSIISLHIEDPYSSSQISTKAKVMWIDEFVASDEEEGVSYEIGCRLLKKKLF